MQATGHSCALEKCWISNALRQSLQAAIGNSLVNVGILYIILLTKVTVDITRTGRLDYPAQYLNSFLKFNRLNTWWSLLISQESVALIANWLYHGPISRSLFCKWITTQPTTAALKAKVSEVSYNILFSILHFKSFISFRSSISK